MKPIILDIEGMSDSTEVYESRPNPIFTVLVYSLGCLLIASLIIMSFLKMDVVVSSNAMVKHSETSATITNIIPGVIQEYYMEDGAFVEEGTVLFVVDTEEAKAQKESYETELEKINQQMEIMEAYLEELDGNQGALVMYKENPYYPQYQNRFENIQNNHQAIKLEFQGQQSQYETNLKSAECAIENASMEKEKMNQVLENITNRQNTFEEDEIYYYSMVENYLNDYKAIEMQYDIKIEEIQGLQSQVVRLEEVEDLQSQVIRLEGQSLTEIQLQIEQLQEEKIRELSDLEIQTKIGIEQSIYNQEQNLEKLKTNQNVLQTESYILNNGQVALSQEQIIVNEKNAVYSEFMVCESKKTEYENMINTLMDNISKGEVQAQTSGYLNLTKESRLGDYLTAGTTFGSIIPKQESTYIVQIYLNNQDIGKVKEGSTVQYEIPAYPSADYGNFKGEILRISEDLKINQDFGTGYYVAEATIVFPEQSGNVELKPGMAIEAKVEVEEKSVLEFLLDKIDLID